tara:strand:+ start:122 stop:430 length:309 start_codon:yes stop_codon:yes gene_type:complete
MPGRLFEVHDQKKRRLRCWKLILAGELVSGCLKARSSNSDGKLIHAIIWFCDFRDSTALSESMKQEIYLVHLNRFFHCMAGRSSKTVTKFFALLVTPSWLFF